MRHSERSLRRSSGCLAMAFGLAGVLLARGAAAVPGGPAFRLEADYGVLTTTRAYENRFSNGPQALYMAEYRAASAGAFGVRATAGYVLKPPQLALFPRVSVAYVPNNEATWVLDGAVDDYSIKVTRRCWSIDVGAELQLFKRQWLIEGAFGIASSHSSFSLPGYVAKARDASDHPGVLGHLATGWRVPLQSPVTFGVKAAVEAVMFTRFMDRLATFPIARAMLSIFIELEPLYAEASQ